MGALAMIRRWSLILAAATALAGCAEEREPPQVLAEETTRRVAQGDVVGFVAPSGAHVWRGLPFAAPPVAENRWRAPRPAAAWKGRRAALAFGPRCPQLATPFDEDDGFEPGEVLGDEDCLTLDVYAPADAAGQALPVMVWIHGGGNVWGRSSQFDGARLAVNENVVVVAVQYRLGPLGWFAHPAIRAAAESAEDAAANFALLDQIAALRWVRENAAVFGGDPGLVTIFGESAGGRNVAGLLVSPPAEGLFHRAVIQSGGFDSVSLAAAEGRQGAQANPAVAIAGKLGVTGRGAADAAALRALPVDRLLGAYRGGPGFFRLPQMIEDGVSLPGEPLIAAFGRPGGFRQVPILIGSNRDEAKLFMFGDPTLVNKRLWLFPEPRDPAFYDAFSDYVSRSWRLRGVDEPAAAMHAAGHSAIYAYRFDWDDGGAVLWTDLSQLLGAAHALEIPFLFQDFGFLGSASKQLFTEETAAERRALAHAMGRYWASFARDGAPVAQGAPDWPRYGDAARFLRLDVASDGWIEPRQGAESEPALLRDLKEDPRLDEAKRCRLIDKMRGWLFASEIAELAARDNGCPTD